MAALSKTVDSGSGASGDYASLNVLESTEQQDLTDGGGDTFAAICTTTGDNAADTIATVFSGWGTGAGNGISVEAASGDRAIVGGQDATRYRLEVSAGGAVLESAESHFTVDGLQIHNTVTGDAGNQCFVVAGVFTNITIRRCRLSAADTGGTGIRLNNAAITADIYNNIIYCPHAQGGSSEGIYLDSVLNVNVYNNTVTNFNDGIEVDAVAGTVNIKNNLVFNNADDFDDTVGVTKTHNASDDGDGDNPQTVVSTDDWAAEVVDAAGGDFTLVLGSVCINNGTDDPGSGLYSDDIAGTTRISPWDISAFELVAAPAVGNRVPIIDHHNRMMVMMGD